MSKTLPSIHAVVTLPERACHKCGSPLLMHQRECGLCGADCRTDDEIAEDLAIERDRERWEEEREYSDRELADKWPGSY